MNTELSYIRNGMLGAVAILLLAGMVSLFQNSRQPDDVSEEKRDVNSSAVAETRVSHPEGKRLFQINCASCHALNKDLTGPALAGVVERWPDRALLKKWILNWSKAVATGDPYPVKMVKWSTATMNFFEGTLTDKEVESIIDYLETDGAKDRVVAMN